MKNNRYRSLLLAAAMSMLPLATTANLAHAAGTLTVALERDDGSWDPIDTFTLSWGRIGSNLYDGLVMRTPDLKLQPGLATSWDFLDDNKRIRFHLRKGVKFHDGEDFNAAAVKFTFDRLLGPEGAKGPQQANYTSIGSVTIVDDYTVDFTLKSPDPVLITKLAGYGAMIVPPKYIQEKGDTYFNLHPVGTGPFKFIDYKPKVSLTLEANPSYWGGAPKLSGLVYRFIPEAATQVSELQSGGVDIATLIPISLTKTISDDPKLRLVSITGPEVATLRFNTNDGITKNPAVRKALVEAVDRDAIIDQILQGNAKPIASLESSLSFGYDPDLKPLPFDPAGAKTALTKAGVKPGTSIELSFVGSDATFREVSQTVAAYLQAVGINVALKSYETNVYYADLVPHGKTGAMYQQTWGGWTFDFDNTAYLLYHSGQFWNPYVKDPKLDDMLEAQRASYNVDERQKILRQIADYTAEQAFEIPLYNNNTLYGVSKRVQNLPDQPDIRYRFLDTTVE